MIKNIVGLYSSVSNHLLLKMQILKSLKSTPPMKGETFIRDFCATLSLEILWEMFRKNI